MGEREEWTHSDIIDYIIIMRDNEKYPSYYTTSYCVILLHALNDSEHFFLSKKIIIDGLVLLVGRVSYNI